jgi:hypothetical protein
MRKPQCCQVYLYRSYRRQYHVLHGYQRPDRDTHVTRQGETT